MILKTKIEWRSKIDLSEEDLAYESAKMEILGDDYIPPDTESEFEDKLVDALIDFENENLFVQIESDRVLISKLNNSMYVPDEIGSVQRIDENITIQSTLDEIYNVLTKSK